MWIARAYSEGFMDRFEPLKLGSFRIGSSFDCDICLLEDGVAPFHGTLVVAEAGLAIIPEAEIGRLGSDGPLPLGITSPLAAFDTLTLGDAFFQLGMEQPAISEAPEKKPAGKRLRLGFAQSLRLAVVATVMIFVMVSNFRSTEAKIAVEPELFAAVQTASLVPDMALRRNPMETPVPEEMVPKTLDNWVREQGITEYEVDRLRGNYQMIVYARTSRERDDLASSLEDTLFADQVSLVVDSILLGAVNLAIGGMGENVTVKSLEYGILTLSVDGTNQADRTRIVEAVRQDIPGLRGISVDAPEEQQYTASDPDIAGVWMGPRRFVISKSGAFVRVGQEVSAGRIVTEITDDGQVIISAKQK